MIVDKVEAQVYAPRVRGHNRDEKVDRRTARNLFYRLNEKEDRKEATWNV